MPRFLADAAYFSLSLKQPQTARTLFEAVCLLAPKSPVGHTGLAEALLACSEPRQAERAARRATRMIAGRPETATAYVTLGRAFLAQGRRVEGLRQLARAQWIDPAGGGGQTAAEELEKAGGAGKINVGG